MKISKETKNKIIKSVKENNFGFVHKCCMCGYECRYVYEEPQLYYDNGCYCTGRINNLSIRQFKDVIELCRMNKEEIVMEWVNES